MTFFDKEKHDRTTISLFAGAGVGDKGFEAAGFRFLLHNEIEKNRAALIKTNFPSYRVLEGDISNFEEKIIGIVREILGGKELFALIATPQAKK